MTKPIIRSAADLERYHARRRATVARYLAKKDPAAVRAYFAAASRKSNAKKRRRLLADPEALAASRAARAEYLRDHRARIRKTDPERHAEEKRKARERKARLAATPEGRARLNAIKLRAYYKLAADPGRYAAYLATVRQRHARRVEQQRLRATPGHAESMRANVLRLIPRSLHPELRDDLAQDLIAAILAGELTYEQIPAVMRSYAAKARGMLNDAFKFVSLDDEIPGTDGLRRIDVLANDVLHF